MTKALARPARNRMAASTKTLLERPMASKSSAVAANPISATLRSMPSAQP